MNISQEDAESIGRAIRIACSYNANGLPVKSITIG